jgi:hypothetical protein
VLRLITLTALFSTASTTYVPYTKGDLMSTYTEPYRTLDCTECI